MRSEWQMLATNFNFTATTVVDYNPPYRWQNPQLDRLDFQPTNCLKIRLQLKSQAAQTTPLLNEKTLECLAHTLITTALVHTLNMCPAWCFSRKSYNFPSNPDKSLLPRSSPGLGVVQGFGSSHLNLEADWLNFALSLSAGSLLQRGRGQHCVSFSPRQSYAFSHWPAA